LRNHDSISTILDYLRFVLAEKGFLMGDENLECI
jgi:hypothetical protein